MVLMDYDYDDVFLVASSYVMTIEIRFGVISQRHAEHRCIVGLYFLLQ